MTGPDQDLPRPAAATLAAALERVAAAVRAHVQAVATRHGLTPLQSHILRRSTAPPPEAPNIARLVDELEVSQPTVSDAVAALERKQLIERVRTSADRRVVRVRATPAGRRLASRLDAVERQLAASLDRLPAPTVEATLAGVLEVIAQLHRDGLISRVRTCTTCRFYDTTTRPHPSCTLLRTPLPPPQLRLDCPEHQPATGTAG